MSLEKILERILDDARIEAERIAQESACKAERIKEENRTQAASMASDLLREAEREAGLEAGRILTQARLETKIEILAARKKLAAEVLGEAFRRKKIGGGILCRTVVFKDGEKKEPLDPGRLLEEIRPGLEDWILTILKI